jgi:hypothetical protein
MYAKDGGIAKGEERRMVKLKKEGEQGLGRGSVKTGI